MAKAVAIDALMESAIQHFARHGFEGASLREIAKDAQVPLSTIDRYFGTKASLFQAVLHMVWAEVERERDDLLSAALKGEKGRAGGFDPSLNQIIDALARPIVTRALSERGEDIGRTKLLRVGRPTYSASTEATPRTNDSDRHLARWMNAISRACPDLARRDVIWCFSYVSGLIYSRQLVDQRFSRFLDGPDDANVDDITRDIASFGEAGILALAARRASSRTG